MKVKQSRLQASEEFFSVSKSLRGKNSIFLKKKRLLSVQLRKQICTLPTEVS